MTTLFEHIMDALNENYSMNQLDHWFDGFSSAQEAIELYSESYKGDTLPDEMLATIEALNEMYRMDVDDIEHPTAQQVIEEWNIRVWGQNFSNGSHSVPFSS